MSIEALVIANRVAGGRKENTTKDLKVLQVYRVWVMLGELLPIISIF